MADEVEHWIEVIRQAQSLADYERQLFLHLGRVIGFEVAFCVRDGAMGPHAPGFDPAVRKWARARWSHYAHGCAALVAATACGRRAVVDREVLGSAAFERTAVYQEVIRPHHGHSSLMLALGADGRTEALIILGRTQRGFRRAEVEQMERLQPVLTVGEFASRRFPAAAEPAPQLSARERDLLAYLRLGYTNREVALALGTSVNTVRNQLVSLFAKLSASSRAEAVARSFELALFDGYRSP